MTYQCHRWSTHRWQSTGRYYEVRLSQDLFHNWILIKSWGGIDSRLGNTHTLVFNSFNEAEQTLTVIHKRRIQRGYQVTSPISIKKGSFFSNNAI